MNSGYNFKIKIVKNINIMVIDSLFFTVQEEPVHSTHMHVFRLTKGAGASVGVKSRSFCSGTMYVRALSILALAFVGKPSHGLRGALTVENWGDIFTFDTLLHHATEGMIAI